MIGVLVQIFLWQRFKGAFRLSINLLSPLLLLCFSVSQPVNAAVDKITSTTLIPLNTPSRAMPESALLDIGVSRLNDGLELTDEDDTVFPEIRFAEATYFSNQLAKILEKSGAWGADSSGATWISKQYKQTVGKYAYDRRLKSLADPFHNLFVRIANDLLAYREKLPDQSAEKLRQLSELRFAQQFAPEAFEAYVAKKRDGTLTIERLPARDDSILRRVQKIRDRDYLYIDSMQDYYDEFSQRMHLPYQDFRRASFDSVVKARQLKKKGNNTLIAGVGAVLAGIYGRSQATTRMTNDAGIATAAVGGYVIKSGLEMKQKAAAYNESVAEMGISLEAEIAPRVIELEDQTITLTGSVQAQYLQWQQLLQKIYQQERGGF